MKLPLKCRQPLIKWGKLVLRLSLKILLYTSCICIAVAFLLMSGLVVICFFLATDAPNMFNQFVKNFEFCKAIVVSPDISNWTLSPTPFDFTTTNTVYEVTFSPRHPFLHEMSISYRCPDKFHYRHDRIWIPDQKISLDMEILHEGEVCRKWHIKDVSTICERSAHNPDGRVVHYFGRFNVADFPWHYKDSIRLRIRLLAPVSGESLLFPIKHPLAVQELHPHTGL